MRLQNAVCFDFMLLGVLTFMLSLLATEHSLRKIVLSGLAIAAVAMMLVDTQELVVVPGLLLAAEVFVAEGVAFSCGV